MNISLNPYWKSEFRFIKSLIRNDIESCFKTLKVDINPF